MRSSAAHWGTRIAGLVFILPVLLSCLWALDIPQWMGFLMYPEQVAGLILGSAMAAIFIAGMRVKHWAQQLLDGGLALLAFGLGVHIFMRFQVLSEGAFFHPSESLVVGILIAITTLEALRRISGWSLIVILLSLSVYALFSDLVPGKLEGRPIPLVEILRFLGTDSTATLGSPLQVAAFVVVLFIFFGQLLLSTGGAEGITDASQKLSGSRSGATARMAVIASGLMGSISGSAVSNVTTTGVITIPAMKRAGFKPEVAGAIEAVASTGGQIMPPVMGAAAFLMAEFLRVPYKDILLAALIPAFLYFFSVYIQISLLSAKHRFESGHQQVARSWRELAPVLTSVFCTIAFLLLALFGLHMSPGKAVVLTCMLLAFLGFFGLGVKTRLTFTDLVKALANTGRAAGQILVVCAVAGMIIGLLSISGLSFALSFVLLQLGENSLLLLLLLTALVSIILGMGLPTTGVYLLLATLAAPPLVELGIGMLEAHFFVLYFGLLSMISPPIALAAFAAASIAQADQVRTAVESVRFGWIAYILPFVFVYRPALLMQGTPGEILFSAFSLVVAVVLITAAIIGYGYNRIVVAQRGVILGLGAFIIMPISSAWLVVAQGAAIVLGLMLIAMHVKGAQPMALGDQS
ncbi:MAG: TRAP transporter fused permease subunit [Proteobacteria bacterium]|nr:TRAP transporter fused permease subunit [Pseudomonadota bacterium]